MSDPSSLKEHPEALQLLFAEGFYYIPDSAAAATIKTQEVKPYSEEKETPIEVKEPEVIKQTSYDYLGENNRYILMLVHEPNHPSISESDRTFLEAILQKGLQLELKDIALLNMAHQPATEWLTLKGYFACNKVVVWGAVQNVTGLNTAHMYQAAEQDQVKLLYVDALAEISANQELKKKLWGALKQMFEV